MGKALDKAQAEVGRLEAEVERWTQASAAKSAEAAEVEAGSGDAILDAGDRADEVAADVAGQVARLRSEASTATATAEAAARRLAEARAEVKRAEAAELREDASRLHRQAEEIETKRDRLLDQLEQLEGARFEPERTEQLAGDGELLGSTPAPTASGRLRRQAYDLEGQAIVIEAEAEGREVEVPKSLQDGSPLYHTLVRRGEGETSRA